MATNADATGGESIFRPDGTLVGNVTSGAFGYSVGKSLALGFIKTGMAPGDRLLVAVLGKPHEAAVSSRPPFDPDGVHLRA